MRQLVLELPEDFAAEAELAARSAGLDLAAYLVSQIEDMFRDSAAADAAFRNSLDLSFLSDEALMGFIRMPVALKLTKRAYELREAQKERELTDQEYTELDRIIRTVETTTHFKGVAIKAWVERHGSLPERALELWKFTPEEAAAWAPS